MSRHMNREHREPYSVGYDSATADFFRSRRAATHAAFFLPHLRAGMRLLDGGCGPGTLTIDLAAVVAPAEAVGIDVAPGQIDLAREQAAERRVANVRFAAADPHALPVPEEAVGPLSLPGVPDHLGHPGPGSPRV